jgi:hypothetical protein
MPFNNDLANSLLIASQQSSAEASERRNWQLRWLGLRQQPTAAMPVWLSV